MTETTPADRALTLLRELMLFYQWGTAARLRTEAEETFDAEVKRRIAEIVGVLFPDL